jgi:hypothetical protein
MAMFLSFRLGGWCLRAPIVLGLLVAAEAALAAQAPQPPIGQDLPEDNFLFRQPRGAVSVRGAVLIPREDSEIFTFVQDQLTIDPGDFIGPGFVTDVSFLLTPRLDVAASFDFAQQTVSSEYRDFVDNDLLPIEQETTLRQTGLTASIRFSLIRRGRAVGRYAWVPARVQPYVGAGGGLLFWEFKQVGDFVDFQDNRVFPDTFLASGTAPSAHVLGGADIQLYKRLFFVAEGRYTWASDDLEGDFVGFDPIDLSGLRLSAGINFVF